ncbi:MAG: ACT domain-containing protein, partial [Methanocorpusculum sp.]|nr:ACT domain-containing protein [Methanocorpusculum sp.]
KEELLRIRGIRLQKNVRTSLRLELKDKPGQLLAAIEPISKSGANIITISHQRDTKSVNGALIVDIVISLPEKRLVELMDALRANGVAIVRIGTEHLTCTKTFILIGHILHTDLTDTVNRIDKENVAEVTELDLVMPGMAEPSTAKLTIKAMNEVEMNQAVTTLKDIAAEKHLLIINQIGGGL